MAAADDVLREGAEGGAGAAAEGQGDQQLMLQLASADGAQGPEGAAAGRGSMFASLSLASVSVSPRGQQAAVRLGHATRVVLGAFAEAARAVPLTGAGRPRLARPGLGGR